MDKLLLAVMIGISTVALSQGLLAAIPGQESIVEVLSIILPLGFLGGALAGVVAKVL